MNRQSPLPPLSCSFWWYTLGIPTLLFAALAGWSETSAIDLRIADHFFDAAGGSWPARHAWWAEWLIHKRGRELVMTIAGGAVLVWGGSYVSTRLRTYRWLALYMVMAIGLGTGAVTLGKKYTGRHCPWDMERYGGSVPYTTLLEGNPSGCRPGNCFPAGHAAGGFSLMAGYFAWRDRRRRIARYWLATGLTLGCIYGYGQMARGAHFLSHNFWSAYWCWLVALLLYLPLRRRIAGDLPETDSVTPP